MNKERFEELLESYSNDMRCDDCVAKKICPFYQDEDASFSRNACQDTLKRYLNGEDTCPEKEYKVCVRFSGEAEYTIIASSRSEAEIKAYDAATMEDVKYWRKDI